jgi:antitoxin CptB
LDKTIPPRLRWACRRGMLELDVLLGNFLEEAYIHQPEEDQKNFVNLLDCNDQDLFMWLTGKETPKEPELIDIIGKIRHHAKIRKHAAFF